METTEGTRTLVSVRVVGLVRTGWKLQTQPSAPWKIEAREARAFRRLDSSSLASLKGFRPFNAHKAWAQDTAKPEPGFRNCKAVFRKLLDQPSALNPKPRIDKLRCPCSKVKP